MESMIFAEFCARVTIYYSGIEGRHRTEMPYRRFSDIKLYGGDDWSSKYELSSNSDDLFFSHESYHALRDKIIDAVQRKSRILALKIWFVDNSSGEIKLILDDISYSELPEHSRLNAWIKTLDRNETDGDTDMASVSSDRQHMSNDENLLEKLVEVMDSLNTRMSVIEDIVALHTEQLYPHKRRI